MKYENADHIFPKELLREIRQYMPEGYVYISPQNGRKEWGSVSGQKEELGKRNAQIYEEYQSGKSIAIFFSKMLNNVLGKEKAIICAIMME